MELIEQKLEILYFQITDIWKKLCEEHTLLLDRTFEEYSHLLSSDINALEGTLEEKNVITERISNLNDLRTDLITDINKIKDAKNEKHISSVSDLIITMRKFEEEKNQKHLFRFNALLIDIIEKIQAQNKKNQLFINKAIMSLQSIREEALGSPKYKTYNNKGASRKGLSGT
tara:strand:+ start:21289 stop:21804 length:516 start_codon:yes stop_codon:yes gene_type:complete